MQYSLQQVLELIAKQPEDANLQHLLGLLYFKNGNPDLALRHLHEALRLAPNNSDSYNNLGSVYYARGQLKEAFPLFEKAIRLNPLNWEAHYNLANCCIKQEQVLQAISHYRTVIGLKPTHANAKINLAMALVSLHDYASALPLLEEAAVADPQHAELQGHLAEAYLDLGQSTYAIEQFNKALLLEPTRAEWHHNLAVLYLSAKQNDLAKQHFTRALVLQPQNQTAAHMLTALQENQAKYATSAPAEYISELFDQYASYYNQHVSTQLNYQVPILLRQAMSKYLNDFSKQLNILDLGCGTGLCGVYFRDLADFLVGVDLSKEMLVQAKALGAYDGLCRCNILETIPGQNRAVYDLIIAADVLVYIGDLKPLFAILCTALRPHGKIAFTVEVTAEQGFVLQSSGRFAHGTTYIQNLCQDFKLSIDTEDLIMLREDNGAPIMGRLYITSWP